MMHLATPSKRLALLTTAVVALALLPAAVTAAASVDVSVAPDTVIQGGTVRVRIRTSAPPTAIRVTVQGKVIPVHPYADGYQTFAGTDPTTPPGTITVRVDIQEGDGRGAEDAHVRVLFRDFGVRRLRVPPLLRPELIAREARLVRIATANPMPAPMWDGPFRHPVNGPLTSNYGEKSVYNGQPRGYHLGVDYRGAVGVLVHAPQHGVVTLAQMLPLSGQTVFIDHGAGLFTHYAHLSAIATRMTPGTRVAPGDVIGRVGATGLVTGPHLHWGMRIHGVKVNPTPWTEAGPLTAP